MNFDKEMKTLRNLIADYAYWQTELSWLGSKPKEDWEFIQSSAETARK